MTSGGFAKAAVEGPDFALPDDPDGWAVFVDVDGTLIDIAPTPDSVIVPTALPAQLQLIADRAGGALALVSGRAIATLDRLFAPARLAAAGLHGEELRLPDGQVLTRPPPRQLAALRPRLAALAAAHPGSALEDKGSSIAIHFRASPGAGAAIERAVDEMVAESAGVLAEQRGKMVIEVKPAGAGKERAVRRLMEHPSFAGRRPLAIGDDLTDEAMFAAANALGGVTIRVGPAGEPTAARYLLPTPSAVRAWIARLAEALS